MRSTQGNRPARARSLLRARPPLYGGRLSAPDRGQRTGEVPYGFAVAEGIATGRQGQRRATQRNPNTVRRENRARNRRARASRKVNR